MKKKSTKLYLLLIVLKNMCEELISVVVFSYNSSSTIIETLDSIYAQTYKNIELIISDDGSSDDTVKKTQRWSKSKCNRFFRFVVVKNVENSGIVANIKRGYAASTGKWVKSIAADDHMLPTCISDFVEYTSKHDFADIVFGKMWYFDKSRKYFDDKYNIGIKMYEKLSKSEFKIAVYKYNPIAAPTAFLRRESYYRIGEVDDNFKMIEDWPLWMKMAHASCNLTFMDKYVVEYRISDNSISNGNNPFRSLYEEELVLVRSKAKEYLVNMNFFSKLYFFSYKKKLSGSLFWKIIHLINALNPFYYQYKHVIKVYNWAKSNNNNS